MIKHAQYDITANRLLSTFISKVPVHNWHTNYDNSTIRSLKTEVELKNLGKIQKGNQKRSLHPGIRTDTFFKQDSDHYTSELNIEPATQSKQGELKAKKEATREERRN